MTRPALFVVPCLLAAAMSYAPSSIQAGDSRPVHFEHDVVPILTRFSCNFSGCHGKAEGQNGFKLSVFGFDPQAEPPATDYSAATATAR